MMEHLTYMDAADTGNGRRDADNDEMLCPMCQIHHWLMISVKKTLKCNIISHQEQTMHITTFVHQCIKCEVPNSTYVYIVHIEICTLENTASFGWLTFM